MSQPQLIVQKYGGATLATPEKIKQVAQRIADLHRSGTQVVAVVSAMGRTTNELIDLAHQVSPRPSLREMDMLLTVGERISMSLLSMALNDLGCAAISFTGSQAGILTDDAHVNANITDVKAFRVEEALQQGKVVILAGFQGVSARTKEITTLGRGGSDISAVAMAGYLSAWRCEILKDVSGVFSADPKLIPGARPISRLNYRQLLEMTTWGAKVLHHESVRLAAEKNVTLFVGAAAEDGSEGTLVSHDIHFSNQFVLAINSFSQVYEIESESQIVDIQKLLQRHQIGQIRPLYSRTQNHFYVTAPQETLQALNAFAPSTSQFKLLETGLCSISITFSRNAEDADTAPLVALLQDNRIAISAHLRSEQSLHLFVPAAQQSTAIQLLHRLME